MKDDFPDYFDFEKKELVICCCPLKGKVPHNESYKFKILCKKEYEKQAIFEIKNTMEKP